MKGKNVLITGGLGFIGSNLAIKLVESGAVVTILDNLGPEMGGNNFNIQPINTQVKVVIGDILDQKLVSSLVKGKDIIFHLAGQVSHVASFVNPFLDIDLNIKGTAILLEECKNFNKNAKIIYAGTRGHYGKSTKLPVDEESPTRPLGIYEVTSLSAEQMVKVYNDTHHVKGVMLRLSNIYGPRAQMKSNKYCVINWFVRQALSNEEISLFGDGRMIRDPLYVEDCVDAMIKVSLNDSCNGEIFNIGHNNPISFLEIVTTITKTAGGSFKFTPFSAERKAQEPGDYYSDVSKVKKFTGWEPKTSFKEGIKKTVEYYKAYKQHYW